MRLGGAGRQSGLNTWHQGRGRQQRPGGCGAGGGGGAGTGGVDAGRGPRQRGNVSGAPPRTTRPGRARTIREAGWGRTKEPWGSREMGVGWGNARPGSDGQRLSPGPGRGSRGRARGASRGPRSGISGPWAGAARAPLSSGARGSAGGADPARAGFPAPAAADGSVPHGPAPPPPAARSAAPGPPPAAATGHGAEPPRGGRAGPGGRADPRSHGPADLRAAASLPRYGASEGLALPARARARPRGPRLQRARTRRATPTPAPVGCQARRSEGTEVARDQGGAEEIGQAHPRDWVPGATRGCGWSNP